MKHYLHFRWKGLVLYLGIHLGNTSVIPSRYDLNWHFELKKDPRLGWNSTKLEVTSINHERIWTPDVTYWNSVTDETELDFPADRGSLRVFSERIQRPPYQWGTDLYGWSVYPFSAMEQFIGQLLEHYLVIANAQLEIFHMTLRNDMKYIQSSFGV